MTYQRFEDLPVWQEAARLFELADDFLECAPSRMRPSFRDQLERAVLSVSNNIAEGFERGTTNELLAFIYIARGSAGEVRSMLTLLLRRKWAVDFKSEISNLKSTAESCSRQLRGWADSLQNSEIKGQRHLNDRVRKEQDQRQRAAALQKKLLSNLPAGHPLRRAAEEKELE
jgi:four helix bundle protein